jgi:hypothetical protein
VNRSIQSDVDGLLLEQGEYLPLEYLLQQGRLVYADYEAWRNGEIKHLDEALFGDPNQLRQQLLDAEDYLKRRRWQVEPLRYEAWRSGTMQNSPRALQFSPEKELNDCFHRCYRKPQDQPQLDLFTDSPATSLANGITLALAERNPTEARRLLERLCDTAPDHLRLGEFERLTEAAERLHCPVDDIRTEMHHHQTTLIPLAEGLLGNARRNLLIPLWRRLSQALQNQPFDASEPELHLSYSAAQALDWSISRKAIERETEWQNQPILLLRHADACERQHDNATALASWFILCWRFPQRAEAIELSSNHELSRQWENFQDLDPTLPVCSFPAWLLINQPSLTRILPNPRSRTAGCPDSYATVYQLHQDYGNPEAALRAANIALRARLKQQDPLLFEHFLKLRKHSL